MKKAVLTLIGTCLITLAAGLSNAQVVYPFPIPAPVAPAWGPYAPTYTCENVYYGWCFAVPNYIGAPCYCAVNPWQGFWGVTNAR